MNSALFVAWRSGDNANGQWGPVGRLERDSVRNVYRFCYTNGARSLVGFKPLTGMPDLTSIYESEKLFPVFANRLLVRSRTEYDAYLSWSGFDPLTQPDPIAILGVTGGRRDTDALEVFPCPVPDDDGLYSNKFFVHGIRHVGFQAIKGIENLVCGTQLGLLHDFSNAHDRHAIVLRTMDRDRHLIGYVPRYLAGDVLRLMRDCEPEFLTVHVERVNPDAPLQHRLLCRMTGCWPESFRPCRDEIYQPIRELVAA
jgi:HIRAN domain